MCAFSDSKFAPRQDEVDDQDLFAAGVLTRYLDKYVDEHIYAGQSLRDRVRFGTVIMGIQQQPDGWLIHCTTLDKPTTLKARKVIVATGSTSVPNLPEFKGREQFEGPIVHTVNYGRSKVYERNELNHVAVIGGGKSAADMVYESVKAGSRVKWIIRKSGKGPGGFLSTKLQVGTIKNAGELAMVRTFFNFIVMPGLQGAGVWQWFLYNTSVGSWVRKKLNDAINNQFTAPARYDDRPGANESFKLLRSEIKGTMLNTPAGAVHHDDFWDTVAQNVDVYREDISHLEKGKIVFTNGDSTEADVILCGTGFRETCPFFTTEQSIQLGLPHHRAAESPETQKEWSDREAVAEKAVRARFYKITPPPSPPSPEKYGDISPDETPFRLYNCIAPTDPTFNHSIAFIGFATVTNMFANSELSAIWATAYIDGNLKLPLEEEMKNDVAYRTTYMRMRNPTYGRGGNFFEFDYYPFIDRLMGEVGLKAYRKTWWQELYKPLYTQDLSGLKDEYIAKYGGRVGP